MEREEAIKYIKSRCIGSAEERDGTQWSEAMWTAIEALSAEAVQPLVLTCDGCRHVGTYDTDFPCSGCIRREKDYYEQER